MKVSVIIPVKDDADRLHECLKRLYVQSFPYMDYEVIVVDNNSVQDIKGFCANFGNVKYIQEPTPGSYAARNRGLSIATGEIIAFTDSDCLPDVDWIAEGVRALIDGNAGIVAGHIQFCFSSSNPSIAEYVDSVLHLNQAHYASEGYAATANLFTWAWMFDAVGQFKPVMSLGDREWGQRVSNAGHKVVYSPNALVFHPARSSVSTLFRKVRMQARHKRFTWQEILNHLLPCNSAFWRLVWRDRNLPTLRKKLEFIGLVHCARLINVWEGLHIKFGGV